MRQQKVLIDFSFRFEISRLPFDWQNPVGYSIAIGLLYIFIFNASFAAICIIVFAIGICVVLISLTEDITEDLENLNESARKIKKNRSEIVKEFIRIVQIHSNSMQLSDFNTGVFFSVTETFRE